MAEHTNVAEHHQPAKVHRQPAFELRVSAYLPSVQQPQQTSQNQWLHHPARDQTVRHPAMRGERQPATMSEEHVQIGHICAENKRCQPLARAILQPRLPECPACKAVCQIVH